MSQPGLLQLRRERLLPSCFHLQDLWLLPSTAGLERTLMHARMLFEREASGWNSRAIRSHDLEAFTFKKYPCL